VFRDALAGGARVVAAVAGLSWSAVRAGDDGAKRVLGIWVAEGAKAWVQALAQVRNRGLEEVLFVCCDGLTGALGAC
jgi:transposase-like protein